MTNRSRTKSRSIIGVGGRKYALRYIERERTKRRGKGRVRTQSGNIEWRTMKRQGWKGWFLGEGDECQV